MVKAKKIIKAKLFEGEPKLSDFEIVEEELPPLKDGDVLCETLWLSVDPHLRVFPPDGKPGMTMNGGVVARIVESRAAEYPKGRYLVNYLGWRTMTIFNIRDPPTYFYPKPYLLPDFGKLPLSLAVGALGMPGVTANMGLLDICDPQPGETVVVNTAAGAVGSIVGQIAKIKGARVIGFTGSDEKVKWLKEKMGFDAVYNYKKVKLADALSEAAPNGVDCYFDNVGGEFSCVVMNRMNQRGRVTCCGAITAYNEGFDNAVAPILQPIIIGKELKVQGYVVFSHNEKWTNVIKENLKWINEGKLKYEETITEGFENAPKAFIEMLRGKNLGKAVVKL